MVDLCRRANLLDPTAVEHDNFFAESHGLGLVMGNVNHRRAQPLMQPRELAQHVRSQGRIEIRERLVEKKKLGTAHNSTAQRHALSLPPAQLLRFAIELLIELQQARDLSDPLSYLVFRRPVQSQREP